MNTLEWKEEHTRIKKRPCYTCGGGSTWDQGPTINNCLSCLFSKVHHSACADSKSVVYWRWKNDKYVEQMVEPINKMSTMMKHGPLKQSQLLVIISMLIYNLINQYQGVNLNHNHAGLLIIMLGSRSYQQIDHRTLLHNKRHIMRKRQNILRKTEYKSR